jgi:hypothetical protein
MADKTITKPQNITCFQLRMAVRLEESGFAVRLFRLQIIPLEQGLPGRLRVAFIR